MARKSDATISPYELYPSEEFARSDLDDARMLDLDGEEESPFLRGQKRVSARRGSLPKKTANRLKWVVLAIAVLFVADIAAGNLYSYGKQSWRFRVESSDDIEITGNHNVTHAQVMEVLGADIGRNIFFIPLAQRRTQIEQIPWVESASVMRFIPNRLKVEIHERTPVAFARVGSRISLIDVGGTIMDLPTTNKQKYSFPVIVGMNPGEPLSTRAARMRIYNDLVHDLDSGGEHYLQDLSEIDLTDPDDVKVLANDPQGTVLVHLGSSNFLERYKIYVAHVQAWRHQFDKLDSVDLRYDRQIIVNPDLRGMVKQAPLSATAARVAAAAGVKQAALLTHDITPAKPAPGTLPAVKPVSKPVATKRWVRSRKSRHVAAKGRPRKTPAKSAKAVMAPGLALPPAPTSVPKAGADGKKAGKKPSPAIAKDQGNH